MYYIYCKLLNIENEMSKLNLQNVIIKFVKIKSAHDDTVINMKYTLKNSFF